MPGDEICSLDWRAYARTDRDYIKLFRKETDMRCHVLLDTSRSMAFRDEAALVAQTTRRPGLFDRLRRRRATAESTPIFPQPADGRIHLLRVDAAEEHAGALLQEALRGRLADPAADPLMRTRLSRSPRMARSFRSRWPAAVTTKARISAS